MLLADIDGKRSIQVTEAYQSSKDLSASGWRTSSATMVNSPKWYVQRTNNPNPHTQSSAIDQGNQPTRPVNPPTKAPRSCFAQQATQPR